MRYGVLIGLVALGVFEAANVWFIMPLPGAQRMRSLELAYQLHTWRWVVRGLAVAFVVVGARSAWRHGRVARVAMGLGVLAVAAMAYAFNFVMAADAMFKQPTVVVMASSVASAPVS